MGICATESWVAYRTEKQIAEWTVFSVNKWPEEQKHKHHKLAWLLHESSPGAGCMWLRVSIKKTLFNPEFCSHWAAALPHSVTHWMSVKGDVSIHK